MAKYLNEEFDYVRHADELMGKKGKNPRFTVHSRLTTTKIRNILALANNIERKVERLEGNHLNQDIINELNYMKVRLAYESGRDYIVKDFVNDADLIKGIDSI